ncbi:MAG: UDP-2,3-diacylglucosamine diphosphatase LpxI [Magnetococcus sp. WYHC-3]
MPAAEEKQLKRLGIIAGGGALPLQVLRACRDRGIAPFVVAFTGQTDAATYNDAPHILTRLGAAGTVIGALKKNDIRDLVLIGNMRRPSLLALRPDFKALQFFLKKGLRALGDDGLLRALRKFLEEEGFTIHGAQDFLPELLMPSGRIGKCEPNAAQWQDIKRGIEAALALGAADIGQAVVVQHGEILGTEGKGGTDELIRSCAPLQREGAGAVLVKLCKPGQDRDLDLPTIGAQTVRNIIEAGFSGLVAHAGQSFLCDREEVTALADRANIFVMGIEAA